MPRPNHSHTKERHSGSSSRAWRGYLVAFGAALLLYVASMAPGVLWQDSGLAQLRALRGDLYGDLGLALAHPLYYLVTFAFQWLPFAESAFKTNLVSVLFGAVTVANVFLVLRLVTGHWKGATVGAVALAVAHTFWQHCALAEVYTVSTALLSAEVLCLLQYARTGRARWLVVLFLANGLGISNHMLAALSLGCYGVMTLWLVIRGRVRWSVVPLLALAWVSGAGLYLGMIVAQIAVGASVGEVMHSALFGTRSASPVLNLLPDTRQLIASGLYLGLSFPTPAALLIIPGLVALRSRELRLVRIMLVVLLVVHLAWAVRYDVPDQYTFFIPALVLLAMVIGQGADRFLQRHSRRWVYGLIVAAALPVAVYASLPRIARALDFNIGVGRPVPYRDSYVYFLRPWKTGYRGAERFAQEVRATLPPGAVLIADSTTVRPIHYLQLTGRWRDDVRVYPLLEREAANALRLGEPPVSQELADGLVYTVNDHPVYLPRWLRKGYRFTKTGPIYRVAPAPETSPP